MSTTLKKKNKETQISTGLKKKTVEAQISTFFRKKTVQWVSQVCVAGWKHTGKLSVTKQLYVRGSFPMQPNTHDLTNFFYVGTHWLWSKAIIQCLLGWKLDMFGNIQMIVLRLLENNFRRSVRTRASQKQSVVEWGGEALPPRLSFSFLFLAENFHFVLYGNILQKVGRLVSSVLFSKPTGHQRWSHFKNSSSCLSVK